MKILVVEDEEHHAVTVQNKVKQYLGPETEILGPYKDIKDVLPHIKDQQPDVALIDIQLEEDHYAGVNIAEVIQQFHPIPILFISGTTNELVIQKTNQIPQSDFLQKPFDDQSFEKALTRAVYSKRTTDSKSLKFKFAARGKDRFWIKTERSAYLQISPKDIVYVESLDHYCKFYLRNNDPVVTKATLKSDIFYGGLSQYSQFYLLGRSHVVNLDQVDYVDVNRLRMKDHNSPNSQPIIIPKTQRAELFSLLGIPD